jgi:hypothetical protein
MGQANVYQRLQAMGQANVYERLQAVGLRRGCK